MPGSTDSPVAVGAAASAGVGAAAGSEATVQIELWSLARASLGAPDAGSAAVRFGPQCDGPVALAAIDGLLLAAGRDRDDQIGVFAGRPGDLHRVGAIEAGPDDVAVVVDLVRLHQRWHLFGCCPEGRTTHHVSDDLVRWERRSEIDRSFPAFGVSGVAAVADQLLLAGRVVVDRSAYGWGLLACDGEAFEARPAPVPLSSQLTVVGPISNAAGDVTLLLDSGTNHTIARSTGRGWTLSLLTPVMVPSAVLVIDDAVWMAGRAPDRDQATLARVGGQHLDEVGPSSHGLIRKAVAIDGTIVFARESR
ncbi:MAG: hypothetical protein AAB131_18210 [Actinomycetota bacterium]